MTSTDWTGISINTTRLDEAIGNITDVWNSNLLADSMNGCVYSTTFNKGTPQQVSLDDRCPLVAVTFQCYSTFWFTENAI